MPSRFACIVGTRPELIKMAPVIKALAASNMAVEVIFTGQHRELLLPLVQWFDLTIHHDLAVMRPGQSLNQLCARLMEGFARLFAQERYDCVVAQGDTSSVLTAGLAAFHERIPFAHVEAGLRTHDRNQPFPEEMNRVLAGRLADVHFAPTPGALDNLRREGLPEDHLHLTGNTVIDALQYTVGKLAKAPPGTTAGTGILVTAHRRENFGPPLERIAQAILEIARRYPGEDILFPVHPNPQVRDIVFPLLAGVPNIQLVEPLAYQDLIRALADCRLVLTDSGGLQEEAPALGKPVLVLREDTERPEVVGLGGAILVGSNEQRIVAETQRLLDQPDEYQKMVLGYSPYGDGLAAERITQVLVSRFGAQATT